jgi:adenylate kinase
MSLYLMIAGVQGAGKGTQAPNIAQHYGIPHISTGDLFRALKTADTPLARDIQETMKAGRLVSDEQTTQLVAERLNQADAQKGAIFDGYPRTLPQVDMLDALLAERQARLSHVIVLNLERDLAIKRLEGRRYSQDMKRTYNVYFAPPKQDGVDDVDGLPLIQRPDDTREAVEKRINDYFSTTLPVLDVYRQRGIVLDINADQAPEAVRADILKALATLRP